MNHPPESPPTGGRKRFWRWVAGATLGLPLLGLGYALCLWPFTPSIRDIRKAATEQPAWVLSAEGQKLTEFKRSNRVWVELSEVAPVVIDALIATEDHRFREHWGLDWRRTLASVVHTLRGERQGGSTLTQQLARNLYPEEIGRAPTLTRKLKEAITALKIEAVYSKDDILETYLNTVPFLYNAYGIEMAARTYFDRSARDLQILQAATLVGMLKGNSYYNPVLNPERALQRRNTVLSQMVKRGVLAESRHQHLRGRPLGLDFERQNESLGPAPHWAQQLRRAMIAWADENGYNLYADGLVIRTSLHAGLQQAANQALARHTARLQAVADATWQRAWNAKDPTVAELLRQTPGYRAALAAGKNDAQALAQAGAQRAQMQALRREKTEIQAGLLALDPRTGHVLAWVGGRDYTQEAFDHVQQARRQPGSTFKPFVYGAALRQGTAPDSLWWDRPVSIEIAPGEVWQPRDDSPPSQRPLSLRQGLAYSKNTVTAQLIEKTGVQPVVRLAQALGVRQSPLQAVPSLALGTSPVTLKEMVTAYGSIANGGQYLPLQSVLQIEDRQGRVLERFEPRPERVLPEHTAWELYDLMRGVVQFGTGQAVRQSYGIRADVAGKTGTTQDHADGWFILMHPQIVTGAWVGFNDSRITLRNPYWGQGAHSALPIVAEVTRQALQSGVADPKARFAAPDARPWWQRWWDSAWAWVSGDKPDESPPKNRDKAPERRHTTPTPAASPLASPVSPKDQVAPAASDPALGPDEEVLPVPPPPPQHRSAETG